MAQNQDRLGSGLRSIACTRKSHYAFPAGWTFDAPATIRGVASPTPAPLHGRGSPFAPALATEAHRPQQHRPSTFDNFMVAIGEATALAHAGASAVAPTAPTSRRG